MENSFDLLNLNDSNVVKFELLLDAPEGERFVLWLDYRMNYTSGETSARRLVFDQCREINLTQHLGFIRGNSIAEAGTLPNSELLEKSQQAWRAVGVDGNDWIHYYIITNTESRIDIIASGFQLTV